MINAIGIALTGLNSAAQKLNASASNIVNAQTAGSLEEGKTPPYAPLTTVSSAQGTGGVLTKVVPRSPAFSTAYDPDSPFADSNGYIGVPNVDIAEEAVTMKIAEISYNASISIIKTQEEMFDELLESVDKKA